MTDIAHTAATDYSVHRSDTARRRLARRYAAERRFKYLGLAAVLTAMAALVLLLVTIFIQGLPAFTQFTAVLPVDLAGKDVDRQDPAKSAFGTITKNAIASLFPFAEGRSQQRLVRRLLSDSADVILREQVLADPGLIGGTQRVKLPVSDTVDLYMKG